MEPTKVKDDTYMPKVDLSKEGSKYLNDTQMYFVRMLDEKNHKRAIAVKKMQRKQRVVGVSLVAITLGVYGWTIHNMRQERFLENLDDS